MKNKVISLNSLQKIKISIDKALLNMDKQSIDDFISSISFVSLAGKKGEAIVDYMERQLQSHINSVAISKIILERGLWDLVKITRSTLMIFCQNLADKASTNSNSGNNPKIVNEIGKKCFTILFKFLQRVNNSDDSYFFKRELGVIDETADNHGPLIDICLEALRKQLSIATEQDYKTLLQGNVVFRKAMINKLHAIFDSNPKLVKYWSKIAIETGYPIQNTANDSTMLIKQMDKWMEMDEKDYTTETLQEIFRAYAYFTNEDNFMNVDRKKHQDVELFINWCNETMGFLGRK